MASSDLTSPSKHRFLPHVTVAVVVANKGRFLFVEEISENQRVINQPAGHLEQGETLIEAAMRETLEETGCRIRLSGVVGINLYTSPHNGTTYHRTTFSADWLEQTDAALDSDILDTVWLTAQEAAEYKIPPRSPLVLDALSRYQQGLIYPLTLVNPLP